MAKRKHSKKQKRDIYQEVTDSIVGYLEQGTAPWRNPIKRGTGDGWPKNLDSGKRYRGINVLLLAMRGWESGFSSDYWMTFKQAQSNGGQVRKGEKGSLVTFWKIYEKKDKESGEDLTLPVLKHYTAFNVEQIDGIEIPDAPADDPDQAPFEPLAEAEKIVEGYTGRPMINHGGLRAFYRAAGDLVQMPDANKFDGRENYYSTLFHELSHSTGHSSRLDRGLDSDPAPFGSPDYSREELIAEVSAAFLCAASGISPPTIEQSAAYLQGWIDVLKGDKRMVVSAAGAAQKSADLILGESFVSIAEESESKTNDEPTSQKPVPDATEPSQLDLF